MKHFKLYHTTSWSQLPMSADVWFVVDGCHICTTFSKQVIYHELLYTYFHFMWVVPFTSERAKVFCFFLLQCFYHRLFLFIKTDHFPAYIIIFNHSAKSSKSHDSNSLQSSGTRHCLSCSQNHQNSIMKIQVKGYGNNFPSLINTIFNTF